MKFPLLKQDALKVVGGRSASAVPVVFNEEALPAQGDAAVQWRKLRHRETANGVKICSPNLQA